MLRGGLGIDQRVEDVYGAILTHLDYVIQPLSTIVIKISDYIFSKFIR
jgi:hypothetical protein